MKKVKGLKLTMLISLVIITAALCCACAGSNGSSNDAAQKKIIKNYKQDSSVLKFNNSKWKYDKSNDVYYMIKIGYCSDPAAKAYETMGVMVPGKYLSGKKNSDGTYTCKVSSSGKVNGYSAKTAPIVFPVNTPGYSAQASPTSYSYSTVSKYMKAGFIYVYAGMRGKNTGSSTSYSNGAPWGVTDLKAAVRYYRFNSSRLPGNTDSIFTFGHSGGGAQSSITGASGDSSKYYSYLTKIGSAMYDKNKKFISDSICGAMCWCPITALDQADEAYEWNMGQYVSSGTRAAGKWTSLLSKDLASEYASYINALKLKDTSGNELSLDKSKTNVYASGSYYDYMLKVVQTSLNNFLKDTKFPYTASASAMNAGMNTGGSLPSGSLPSRMSSSSRPSGTMGSSGSSNGKTYKTAAAYIKYLNSNAGGKWIKYDKKTNTVKVTSMKGFVRKCKNPSKDVCAFDSLTRAQAENYVFGNDDHSALHFDQNIEKILEKNKAKYAKKSGFKSSYASAYKKDLGYKDSLGKSISYRSEMYNPMYYLCDYYKGYGTSTPAKYWRINTGIEQGDTALDTEVNLALALKQVDSVKSVKLTTVWAQGHTQAERSGTADGNFIKWVNKCVSEN